MLIHDDNIIHHLLATVLLDDQHRFTVHFRRLTDFLMDLYRGVFRLRPSLIYEIIYSKVDIQQATADIYETVRAVELQRTRWARHAINRTGRCNESDLSAANDGRCGVTGLPYPEVCHIIPLTVFNMENYRDSPFFRGLCLIFGYDIANYIGSRCGGSQINSQSNKTCLNSHIHLLMDTHRVFSIRPWNGGEALSIPRFRQYLSQDWTMEVKFYGELPQNRHTTNAGFPESTSCRALTDGMHMTCAVGLNASPPTIGGDPWTWFVMHELRKLSRMNDVWRGEDGARINMGSFYIGPY